ncbi:uncharacterized protein TM35_000242590 [Trypanosoma theileri]|uniref:Uncharacterized protein n=1 Tax=Trypanosoma theileri TaxID=67003 RepID=A0A1X0NSE8_9TRYP|nr:uncharacterized protein TM35_000242590 [Trypanosoma theileri]ORC87109.1 hypothetical protein TM35_000242590 [Trypanosoma theileri]
MDVYSLSLQECDGPEKMGCSQSELRGQKSNQPQQLQGASREEEKEKEKKANGVNANPTERRASPQVKETRTPAIPPIPPGCWYAQPFTETTTMNLTEYHMKQRGRVVFSNAYIPVGASELESLPGHAPLVRTTLKIGTDLVYGMAYFHSTPLYIEYYWRSRVAHYNKMCKEKEQQQEEKKREEDDVHPSTSTLIGDKENSQRDLVKTIYDRPYFDTFVAFKVYVDDKLVPDHYPSSKSIPNCTATIFTSEAFNNWICIPVVLIGYLNNFLLSTISLYRYLSLNFVEYLLQQSSSLYGNDIFGSDENTNTTNNNSNSNNSVEESNNNQEVKRVFKVRVEVVYGCRSEMNFCTDYISKGSVNIVMTKKSRGVLKSYEEKLRKLIQRSLPVRDQLIPMDRLALVTQEQQEQQQQRSRVCLFCNSPLRFTCTICGAQLCGTTACVWRPFTGYPHGCSVHKAQI